MWSPWAWEMMTYRMSSGFEAEPFQPADDQFFRVIRVDRVDDDDALARGQRPRGVNLAADEVEVVEDLGG